MSKCLEFGESENILGDETRSVLPADGIGRQGGRTQIIFYDQDRIMVVSENEGNNIYTKEITTSKERERFDVYLCNKSDPDTKGKIENVIRYIKYNFFDRYEFYGMDRLNSDILIWLDRSVMEEFIKQLFQCLMKSIIEIGWCCK